VCLGAGNTVNSRHSCCAPFKPHCFHLATSIRATASSSSNQHMVPWERKGALHVTPIYTISRLAHADHRVGASHSQLRRDLGVYLTRPRRHCHARTCVFVCLFVCFNQAIHGDRISRPWRVTLLTKEIHCLRSEMRVIQSYCYILSQ
jgi:hypothetical protein